MYKKLTAVRQKDDVARIQEELEDRYGDPPRSVWNLLAIMRLRLRCQEVGIGSIVAEKRRVAIRFAGTHLAMDATKRLARTHMQHQFLPDVVFLATPDTPAKMLTQVEEMVEVIAKVLPPKADRPHGASRKPPCSTSCCRTGTVARMGAGRTVPSPAPRSARRRRQGPGRQDGGREDAQPGEQSGVGAAARHVQPALGRTGCETPGR